MQWSEWSFVEISANGQYCIPAFDTNCEIIQLKFSDEYSVLLADSNVNGGGCGCCGISQLTKDTQWRKLKVL